MTCPAPERAVSGLLELFLNAIEHGNLAIDGAHKAELFREGTLSEEITRRLAMPAYRERLVTVTFERSPHHLTFVIKDCGEGFDYQKPRPLKNEENGAYAVSGRGLYLARTMSFSSVDFEGCGNQVRAVVSLEAEPTTGEVNHGS